MWERLPPSEAVSGVHVWKRSVLEFVALASGQSTSAVAQTAAAFEQAGRQCLLRPSRALGWGGQPYGGGGFHVKEGTPGWRRGHRYLEMRKKRPPPLQTVGLRFLGTDLGPQMGPLLWEVLMSWGAAWAGSSVYV